VFEKKSKNQKAQQEKEELNQNDCGRGPSKGIESTVTRAKVRPGEDLGGESQWCMHDGAREGKKSARKSGTIRRLRPRKSPSRRRPKRRNNLRAEKEVLAALVARAWYPGRGEGEYEEEKELRCGACSQNPDESGEGSKADISERRKAHGQTVQGGGEGKCPKNTCKS